VVRLNWDGLGCEIAQRIEIILLDLRKLLFDLQVCRNGLGDLVLGEQWQNGAMGSVVMGMVAKSSGGDG
jgi:hypothetical protein